MRLWFRSLCANGRGCRGASGFLRPRRYWSRRWLIEEHSGFLGALGQLDVTHGLLGQPGAQKLVTRIAASQPEKEGVVLSFVELFVACEEDLPIR